MPFFSEKTHKILLWIAQILLPGLGALYFGLAKIWGASIRRRNRWNNNANRYFLGRSIRYINKKLQEIIKRGII